MDAHELRRFHSDSEHVADLSIELLKWSPERLATVSPDAAALFIESVRQLNVLWSSFLPDVPPEDPASTS